MDYHHPPSCPKSFPQRSLVENTPTEQNITSGIGGVWPDSAVMSGRRSLREGFAGAGAFGFAVAGPTD